MPLAPYSGYVTLVFLLGVLVLMALDPEKGLMGDLRRWWPRFPP